MGKKGSWFSAIKRVFTHHSKGKVIYATALLRVVLIFDSLSVLYAKMLNHLYDFY